MASASIAGGAAARAGKIPALRDEKITIIQDIYHGRVKFNKEIAAKLNLNPNGTLRTSGIASGLIHAACAAIYNERGGAAACEIPNYNNVIKFILERGSITLPTDKDSIKKINGLISEFNSFYSGGKRLSNSGIGSNYSKVSLYRDGVLLSLPINSTETAQQATRVAEVKGDGKSEAKADGSSTIQNSQFEPAFEIEPRVLSNIRIGNGQYVRFSATAPFPILAPKNMIAIGDTSGDVSLMLSALASGGIILANKEDLLKLDAITKLYHGLNLVSKWEQFSPLNSIDDINKFEKKFLQYIALAFPLTGISNDVSRQMIQALNEYVSNFKASFNSKTNFSESDVKKAISVFREKFGQLFQELRNCLFEVIKNNFIEILYNKCDVPHSNVLLSFKGDLYADSMHCDGLTSEVLKFLHKNGCHYEINFSNHDFELIKLLRRHLDSIGKSKVFENPLEGFSLEEFREVYLNKLVLASISPDHKTIQIHAMGTPQLLLELAGLTLEEFIGRKYNDAKVVDLINSKFKQLLEGNTKEVVNKLYEAFRLLASAPGVDVYYAANDKAISANYTMPNPKTELMYNSKAPGANITFIHGHTEPDLQKIFEALLMCYSHEFLKTYFTDSDVVNFFEEFKEMNLAERLNCVYNFLHEGYISGSGKNKKFEKIYEKLKSIISKLIEISTKFKGDSEDGNSLKSRALNVVQSHIIDLHILERLKLCKEKPMSHISLNWTTNTQVVRPVFSVYIC